MNHNITNMLCINISFSDLYCQALNKNLATARWPSHGVLKINPLLPVRLSRQLFEAFKHFNRQGENYGL
jgi:hypothetical protein